MGDDIKPMTDEEFIEDRQNALRESIEYFESKNKPERERWVCIEFVENLRLTFEESEALTSDNDPPDVIFRDALFEIKEILDPGRRRHDEYKLALHNALQATDPKELLTEYSPIDITPQEIGDQMLKELDSLAKRYAPEVRAKLDLLFYVNLQDHLLKAGEMPSMSKFSSFGWRSISAVFGWGAFVFFATVEAPPFLYSRAGTMTLRKFE